MDDGTIDPEVAEVAQRYVLPGHRFMYLVAGNLRSLGDPALREFGQRLAQDAREVTDIELRLLFQGGWRERLTGAWLAGMDYRVQMRPLIADLLLADELVSAGQGYCFASARFGTAEDAGILIAYLDRYLSVFGGHQDWALGALLYLDAKHGTDRAAPFLTPGGPWDQWTVIGKVSTTYTNPPSTQRMLTELCAFGDTHELPRQTTTKG